MVWPMQQTLAKNFHTLKRFQETAYPTVEGRVFGPKGGGESFNQEASPRSEQKVFIGERKGKRGRLFSGENPQRRKHQKKSGFLHLPGNRGGARFRESLGRKRKKGEGPAPMADRQIPFQRKPRLGRGNHPKMRVEGRSDQKTQPLF